MVRRLNRKINHISERERQLLAEMAANLERIQSEEDLLIYLEAIEKGSQNVSRLISDFMMLVELRTGQATDWYSLQSRPTELNDIVEQVSLMATANGSQPAIILQQNLSRDVGKVMIDPDLLAQCLRRLVSLIITLCRECPGPQVCRSLVPRENGHRVSRTWFPATS